MARDSLEKEQTWNSGGSNYLAVSSERLNLARDVSVGTGRHLAAVVSSKHYGLQSTNSQVLSML